MELEESVPHGTLSPLPQAYRHGLIAVALASFLSFVSTALLFLFLTHKLLLPCPRRTRCPTEHNFTTAEIPIQLAHGEPTEEHSQETAPPQTSRNPFPMLIYNLLVADMQDALAYVLNLHWLISDGIFISSPVCWAQGWLLSNGKLAASLFLSVISANTFLTVVHGYKPTRWATYTCILCIWISVFTASSVGIIVTENGASGGGWYTRANTWCWINSDYEPSRLWTHYFWILTSIGVTMLLYVWTLFTLWRQKRSSRFLPLRNSAPTSVGKRNASGHHPAFLAYPCLYIICTAPIAVLRVANMAGVKPNTTTYCFVGTLVACNGFFNSILWTATILFSAPQDIRDAGLSEFAFVRTPARPFGNTIWIHGPASKYSASAIENGRENGPRWWWWNLGGQTGWGNKRSLRQVNRWPRGVSQDALWGSIFDENCIHIDVSTKVIVEQIEDPKTSSEESSGGKQRERAVGSLQF
ncbi:uncharacterized protein BCR38DRAFT_398472 [Pseudomassariella vexata]|uniref:Uncharacterized protein n=1 Tax=Pseudomassariella vexata TaxID=1141098 RepID=A0A1Y2DM77_9PEZI|nr:uncharacterized protein BCR38DRAFT_398472 [Pseudomassariella vexata]ORY60254.1 hypothetical protein BCR38DRAFT_398472 [Pseudomassariella vexata]